MPPLERDQWSGLERQNPKGRGMEKKGEQPAAAPEAAPAPAASNEKKLSPTETLRNITRGEQAKKFGAFQKERAEKKPDDPERLNISDMEIALVGRVIDELVKEKPGVAKLFMDEGADIRAKDLIKDGKRALLERIFADRTHPMYQNVLRALEKGADPRATIDALANGAEEHLRAARAKAVSEREKAERDAGKAAGAAPKGGFAPKGPPKPSQPEPKKSGLFGGLFGKK
jgi:hypothetical protein